MRRYLSADERGSIVSVSDSSGASLAINAYDEYGIPAFGALADQRFGYTGQAWLPSVGVWYYKARVYAPQIGGRFLQPDPIGYWDSPNLYAYVLNDPLNLVDPLGLQGEDIIVEGVRLLPIEPAPAPPPGPFVAPVVGLVGSEPSGNFGQDITVVANRLPRRTPITHEFTVTQFTQCPAGQAFEHLMRPGMSAPGVTRATPGLRTGVVLRNPLTGVPTGDTIIQVVSPSALTILNITEPGHRYHPGTVELRVNPLTTSSSMVVITGVGRGQRAVENVVAGRFFFGTVATVVGILCAGS